MISKAVFAVLGADADVSALVGTRIYPAVAPQGAAAPRLVYTRAGGASERTFEGETGTRRGRVQVDAYADTYIVAADLAKAARAALVDFSGVAGGVTVSGVSPVGDVADTFEDKAAPPLWRVRQDYQITFMT